MVPVSPARCSLKLARPFSQTVRSVSTSSAAPELLVVFPDNPNVLERRIAIRPRHSPNFVRLHNEGYVSWAGPLFERHVTDGIRPFKGSAMVIRDENKGAVMEKLASDIYVKEKIWDTENALVVRFRTIMRWQE